MTAGRGSDVGDTREPEQIEGGVATGGEVGGRVTEALDGSGNVTAAQLYTPYGTTRYGTGTMPTAYAFTGQRADAATGLDYYNARYYDPLAGQFASADDVLGPNRFRYVQDNPETYNDPTGHIAACALDIFHSLTSGDGWAGTGGTCASEGLLGARAAKQAQTANNLVDLAFTTYKSGNFKYLTDSGEDALKSLMSHGSLFETGLSGLKDSVGLLKGTIGFGPEAGDSIVNQVKTVITATDEAGNAVNVAGKGVGGGASKVGQLNQAVDDAEAGLAHGKFWAKMLGVGAVLLTWAVAGYSDYTEHGNIARAVVVGGLHAGLSWAGAAAGGAVGGALGGLIGGPVGFVVGSFIGASAGGFLGDLAATGIVNFADSGLVQNTWNTVTSDVSQGEDWLSNQWNNWTSGWSW